MLNFTSDLEVAISIPPNRNLSAAASCIFAFRHGAAVGGNKERGQEEKVSAQSGETIMEHELLLVRRGAWPGV